MLWTETSVRVTDWMSGYVDRSYRIRHQNALTEKTWDDALQGKGIL